MSARAGSIVSVFSARPDGATSIALGLAALLSRTARVLLIDLCLERAEVAPLLDVDDRPNLYELTQLSRLWPLGASDLEAHVQWRDGLGVLAGTALRPERRGEVTDLFIEGLLLTAATRFDHVIVDLGRPRPEPPPAVGGGVLAWVVAPSPLGMAALDRAVAGLDAAGCAWLRSAQVVLNRVHEASWRETDRFIEREYGMRVAGQVPLADEFWRALEKRHSPAPFCVPVAEPRRYLRAYGSDAWRVRQALEGLAAALVPERRALAPAVGEG